MSITGASPYCLPCDRMTHWIEIYIRDEFNRPFSGVRGTLLDYGGNAFPIYLDDGPIFIDRMAPGPATILLECDAWIPAAQGDERIPNSATDSDPTKEFADNHLGHKGSATRYFEVTAGDLTELSEGLSLPSRHQKGQADKLKLITDKSYVLKVRGFNFITLRVGMFFDGTANNTYSAQWGKSKLDSYYHKWYPLHNLYKDRPPIEWPEEVFKFPEQDKFRFFWQEDHAVKSSAANELTNIQKLYGLYPINKLDENRNVFSTAQYVTGIGTGNETDNTKPADESVLVGQAMGLGKYGVEAKVVTAIEQLSRSIEGIINLRVYSEEDIDGFSSIEFDVFGFSRGAAAARHFVNLVIDGKRGVFAEKMAQACIANNIELKTGFNWNSDVSVSIKFVGLFDTVAAMVDLTKGDISPHNNNNGGVRLWLDPDRVKRVVHLTAHKKTEYRRNFSLNRINSAEHFHEYVVPGAHSDIGGGYHSLNAYTTLSRQRRLTIPYLLPLLENKPIKLVIKPVGYGNIDEVKRRIIAKLEPTIKRELALGWNIKDYHIDFQLLRTGNKKRTRLQGTLYQKRVVSGDLSRLYLRVMFGLAQHYGVPLSDNGGKVWYSTEDSYYSVPTDIGKYRFADFCDKALEAAKSGELLEELNTSNVSEIKDSPIINKLFDANLIHHSSDNTIANKPNKVGECYQRQTYPCLKES
ncbi:T6SS phospholipase effector Tle1-like catalytic domain-containing protein [Vibrio brasiliensis]